MNRFHRHVRSQHNLQPTAFCSYDVDCTDHGGLPATQSLGSLSTQSLDSPSAPVLSEELIQPVAANMSLGPSYQQNNSNTRIFHTVTRDHSLFPQLATPGNTVTSLDSGLLSSSSLPLNPIAHNDHDFVPNPIELNAQSMPAGASITNYSAYHSQRGPVNQNLAPLYNQRQQQPPGEWLSHSSNLNEGQLQFSMDAINYELPFPLYYYDDSYGR